MPCKASVAGAVTCLSVAASVCLGQSQQGPREYAVTLVQNRVPVGLVLERGMLEQGKPIVPPESSEADRAAFRERLTSSLDLFNAAGGTFRATEVGGVVHLRSVDEPTDVTDALRRQDHTPESLELPLLGAVFRRGAATLTGSEPQAVVGSGPVPRPGPGCPLETPVHVPAGSATVVGLLDGIVRQVPGVAWVVTYDGAANRDLKLHVGLLCSDGSHIKISAYP